MPNSKPLPANIDELLAYNADSGVLSWLVRPAPCSLKRAGDEAGSIWKSGYRVVRIGKRAFTAHRIAYRLMTGQDPIGQIDHIDRDRANNRWVNLRLASASENTFNRQGWGRYPKGVRASGAKFFATIAKSGTQYYLGTFGTIAEASAAYAAAAERLYGEFAGAE